MTHILIPREPSPALLRPFVGCPQEELPQAYAAMIRIAEVERARAGSQCLAQIEEPAGAAPAAVAPLPAVFEQIAQSWDGCMYDAPGETLDIGADIRAAAKRLLAEHPAAVAPSIKGLLDEDGENQAVRMLLMVYGQAHMTVPAAWSHMKSAGWPQAPEWVASEKGPLTKGGAQSWLRHLFALEGAAPALEAPAAPSLDAKAIASGVCQRVADMDDRSSPSDWPEAMLVTGPELVEIVEGEIAQAMANAVAAPIMPTALHVAARYWQWLEIMGRLTSFSTFVNEFGYEKEDCKQVYEQVVLPCFSLLAAAPQTPAQEAPESHTQALRAIADWPVTDMLMNMDAANMRGIAQRALAAAPQAPAAPAVDASPLLAPETELDAVVRDAEQIIRDAEHYRFIKRHRLILSGGTDTFGWPIAPFGDECDRYIAQELATERAAQAKEGGA